jgi:hypothetical protein
VEEYHESLKVKASLAKSPTKTIRTQSNHCFASIYAFVKLERMKMATKLNHFRYVLVCVSKPFERLLRSCRAYGWALLNLARA